MSNAMIGRMKCGHAVAISDDATDADRATFEGRGYAVEMHPRDECFKIVERDFKDHRAKCKSERARICCEHFGTANCRCWEYDMMHGSKYELWERKILPLLDRLKEAHEALAREQRMAEQSRRDAAALSEYVELARPVVEAVRDLMFCHCPERIEDCAAYGKLMAVKMPPKETP